MALIEDPKFRDWVEKYAADQDLFFKDFAMAFRKLIGMCGQPIHRKQADSAPELGVDRDDTGFAQLVKKSAEEGKPLDRTAMPSGGTCPFAGTGSKGREAPKGRAAKL